MGWTRDLKGFFDSRVTLPTIPSAGNKTEHTDWFSYGDFG